MKPFPVTILCVLVTMAGATAAAEAIDPPPPPREPTIAAAFVDREGDGVGDVGLGGEWFDGEARRQAESRRGLGGLVGSGRDRGLPRRRRRIDRLGRGGRAGHRDENAE
ncbi:MAG: hypothetical protein ACKOHK_04835, partial [Planctomycetia bacterium]